jgi:hypothetical protein
LHFGVESVIVRWVALKNNPIILVFGICQWGAIAPLQTDL